MFIATKEIDDMKQTYEELEQKRVELFKIKDELKKEKRKLNKEIKDEQQKLDYELELEKEFSVMCNNINLGRGKYYELINLPYKIETSMDESKYETLSDEDKSKFKANIELATQISNDINNEYEQLLNDRPERLKRIKSYKKKLYAKKRELYLKNKKERKELSKVKRLDKKMDYLRFKTSSNKVVFRLK